ncbi:MAG: hypothetical protein M3Y32_09785 [Pseudomonadota bacterium]|nr:hypothetical protein [Pseudomonadota bacterium]
MAGFEGADHRNCHGLPLDMVATTGHAERFEEDYRALAQRGIRVVRESIGWRLCEPQGMLQADSRFDFQRLRRMAQAARRQGVQVLWTLMHYGVPPDVSLMDDRFCARFAEFAAAVADALAPLLDEDEVPVFTPINEISFLAWAACETNLIHPHVGDRNDPRHVPLPDGYVLKCRLVRACLAGMQAIRARLPSARFLHVDPLVHVVAPADASAELAAEARRFREYQWQTWDLIAGRLEPALGGSTEALDMLGVNHYPTAQWEFQTGATLAWRPGPGGDGRRLALSALLQEASERYRRPIVIAETGACDGDRAGWLAWVDTEATVARAAGVDLRGVCLYPVIGRPDWNDANEWHRCGLWDAVPADPAAVQALRTAPIAAPGRHLVSELALTLAQCVARTNHAIADTTSTSTPTAELT